MEEKNRPLFILAPGHDHRKIKEAGGILANPVHPIKKIKRIAVLSVHSCPQAALGGKETGGMNVYVRELSRQMGRRGIQVDIFTRSQNPHISPIARMGPRVQVIHIRAGPEEPMPKQALFQFLPEFVDGVLRFGEKERITYDLIHSHYWLSGWVGGRLKYRWGTPLIHMFHTLGVLKNAYARGKEDREPGQRIIVEGEIMALADGLVAPNPWEKEQMIRQNGVPSLKIKVIPCGVDLGLFRPIAASRARKILGLSDKPFLLYVGRIDAIKGIETLIHATHRLSKNPSAGKSNWGLIIIGGELDEDLRLEDREMRRLRKLVERKRLQDRIAFWGSQRQTWLPHFYSAAEALVIPSRYESFGMVALEAMACGTPVIASKVGGLQYTIQDGKTGFLFPEGDWKLLAAKIEEVLGNPFLRRRLAQAGISRARKFAWPLVTNQILTLYRSILK